MNPSPNTPRTSGTRTVHAPVTAGPFTTLAAAITAAGLLESLNGPGPLTVFPSTDVAFAKLPAGTVQRLREDPRGRLAGILTYHLVPGEVTAAAVVTPDGQRVTTAQGAELTVEVVGDTVSLLDAAGNHVEVVTPDVPARDGATHVIDAVLLPSA